MPGAATEKRRRAALDDFAADVAACRVPGSQAGATAAVETRTLHLLFVIMSKQSDWSVRLTHATDG